MNKAVCVCMSVATLNAAWQLARVGHIIRADKCLRFEEQGKEQRSVRERERGAGRKRVEWVGRRSSKSGTGICIFSELYFCYCLDLSCQLLECECANEFMCMCVCALLALRNLMQLIRAATTNQCKTLHCALTGKSLQKFA